GSPCFLLATKFPSFARRTRRTEVHSLLWSIRYCLDRRGCRHTPDKASRRQHLILPIGLHHRVHIIPTSHRINSQRGRSSDDCQDTCLPCAGRMVSSSGCEYPWRVWCCQEQGWSCSVPSARLLHWLGLLVFYQLIGRLDGRPKEKLEAMASKPQTA
ncbi:hypothetical protein E4T44_13580, partial [Aureobasidium sp. EXF-8845]